MGATKIMVIRHAEKPGDPSIRVTHDWDGNGV